MFIITAVFYSVSFLLAISGETLAVVSESQPDLERFCVTKKAKSEILTPGVALKRNAVLFEECQDMSGGIQGGSELLQLPKDCLHVICAFLDYESLVMFSQTAKYPFVISYPPIHSELLQPLRNAYLFQLGFGEFDMDSQMTLELSSDLSFENSDPLSELTGQKTLQILLPIISKIEEAHAVVAKCHDEDIPIKSFLSGWAFCFSAGNIEFSNEKVRASLSALNLALPLFETSRVSASEIMRHVVRLGNSYPERMGFFVQFLTLYPNLTNLSEFKQSLIFAYTFLTFTQIPIDAQMVSSALSLIQPQEDSAIQFQDENFVMEVFEKLKEEATFVDQFFE